MRRVGDAVPLPALQAAVDQRRQAYQAWADERRAQFGFAEGSCPGCGGFGITPEASAVRARPTTESDEPLERGGIQAFCSCEAGEERRALRDRMREWPSRVPRRLADYRLETAAPGRALDLVREWFRAEPWMTGASLVLGGSPGSGKTGLAVGALYEAHLLGIGTFFVSVPDWIEVMRPTRDEAKEREMERITRRAERARLLAFDDLGAERATEWVVSKVHGLIDHRYAAQLPTIVTTNLSDRSSVADIYGDRTVDRLLQPPSIAVRVVGANLRSL